MLVIKKNICNDTKKRFFIKNEVKLKFLIYHICVICCANNLFFSIFYECQLITDYTKSVAMYIL